MMKTQYKPLILIAVLLNLSACSTIKSWFPDKEKDYQFTTEIPPLTVPPDLAGDSITAAPAAGTANAASSDTANGATEAAPAETNDARPSAPPAEEAPAIERKLIQVELVDSEQETKQLRIGAPSAIAWRMVGKALSRKAIEVTNRNQEEGLFHVQYDPNRKAVEDESFWDELNFVLSGFEVTEQEFVIKLVENNQQTSVIIMDKEQKPVAGGAGLSLLTLLHDTITADLAK
jgi:outer membrane protein assembly factor BamC